MTDQIEVTLEYIDADSFTVTKRCGPLPDHVPAEAFGEAPEQYADRPLVVRSELEIA